MKVVLWTSFLLPIPLFALAVDANAQPSFDLPSPDKQIEARIRTTLTTLSWMAPRSLKAARFPKR